MCLWSSDTPVINPIDIRDITLAELIINYINLAESFDINNVFLIESNPKFGKLLHLEYKINSMKAITSKEKVLYREFLKSKKIIDEMVLPTKHKKKEVKMEIIEVVPIQIKPIDTALYKMKVDKNQKKYRSVLIIIRDDIMGLEIEKKLTM
jgi:hypothetical protein